MLRTAFVVVLLCTASVANAVVLCARQRPDGTFNTSVKIREACKPAETQLDPAALGLCCQPSTTTTTSTSSSTSTTLAGTCGFSGAPCTTAADCGIPGVCFAPDQVCHHACTDDDDCPGDTFCFEGDLGTKYCVGCGGTTCSAEAVCHTNDCKQFGHAECTTSGLPCTISDPCLPVP